jgi:hypothetical protein
MTALRRLEDGLSGWLERAFARLTRTSLQPVTIARRLERALEDGLVVESGRTLAPNQYWVFLHPQDYQGLKSVAATLEADLGEHLARHATRQGWRLLTPPQVRLNPGQDVRRHDVRVIAQLLTAPAGPIVTETQPLTPVSPPAHDAGGANADLRTLDDTVVYPLAHVPVDVGRGRGNDIILDDARVSRHHAQIRRRRGAFVVFDLDSANGTFVNGRPVEEAILADGDRVSFGGVELVFMMQDT